MGNPCKPSAKTQPPVLARNIAQSVIRPDPPGVSEVHLERGAYALILRNSSDDLRMGDAHETTCL
jgi:hypothetical protein